MTNEEKEKIIDAKCEEILKTLSDDRFNSVEILDLMFITLDYVCKAVIGTAAEIGLKDEISEYICNNILDRAKRSIRHYKA